MDRRATSLNRNSSLWGLHSNYGFMKKRYALYLALCLSAFQAMAQNTNSYLRELRQFARYGVTESNSRQDCQANFIHQPTVNLQDSLSFPVAFSNVSIVSNFDNVTFSWDFGDGSTSTEVAPVHVYTSYNPYYEVCLTVNDGDCISTFCDTVDLDAIYNADPCFISFLWQHQANSPNTVSFLPTFNGGDMYCWDFGDGTTDTLLTGGTVNHVYANPGNYTVCLVMYNYTADCATSTCMQISAEAIQNQATGPMTINQLPTVIPSIQNILFGDCVNVSNISFYGSTSAAIGYFSDSAATIGFDYGLLLTTGLIFNAIGPNTVPGAGTDINMPGDYLLDMEIPGFFTRDAVSINFEFTAQADTIIACEFVFASEEYPEYVGSQYNDVFGFYIQGPGTNGWENLARVPGTNLPITVNTLNANLNNQYYVNNTPGLILQYDAYTTPMQLQYPVQAGETYQFRIIIADAGDGIYDSGVFIKGGSFLGNEPLPAAMFDFSSQGYTVEFENQSTGADAYLWSFGDGSISEEPNPQYTYSQSGFYNVRLVCTNQCYARDTTVNVAVTPGEVLMMDSPFETGMQLLDDGNVRINYAMVNASALQIEVFNAAGQKVFERDLPKSKLGSELLDLSGLTKGIYVLRISADHSLTQSHKLLR